MSLMEGEKTLSLFLPISLRLSELNYDLDRKLELPLGFKTAISVETMVHCLRLQCGSGRRVLMRLVYQGQTSSWVNQEGTSLVHSLSIGSLSFYYVPGIVLSTADGDLNSPRPCPPQASRQIYSLLMEKSRHIALGQGFK